MIQQVMAQPHSKMHHAAHTISVPYTNIHSRLTIALALLPEPAWDTVF